MFLFMTNCINIILLLLIIKRLNVIQQFYVRAVAEHSNTVCITLQIKPELSARLQHRL